MTPSATHLRMATLACDDQTARAELTDYPRAWSESRTMLHEASTIESALIDAWSRREGLVLTVGTVAGPSPASLLQMIATRACVGKTAVAHLNVDVGTISTDSLVKSLSSGRSPVLSLSCARAVGAMADNPLKQARLLEEVLRRHACHRPLLIAIEHAHHLDRQTEWILRRLQDQLRDAPIAWLYSYPVAPHGSRPERTAPGTSGQYCASRLPCHERRLGVRRALTTARATAGSSTSVLSKVTWIPALANTGSRPIGPDVRLRHRFGRRRTRGQSVPAAWAQGLPETRVTLHRPSDSNAHKSETRVLYLSTKAISTGLRFMFTKMARIRLVSRA